MNYFTWWPTVSETLEHSKEKEERGNLEKTNLIADWAGLYNTKNIKDNIDEWFADKQDLSKIEKINTKKIEENPFMPLLETLTKQNLITTEEQNLLKKSIIDKWEKSIDEIVDKTNWIDKWKRQKIKETFNFLGNDSTKEKCKKQFNIDFSDEIKWLKKQVEWWKKWEKELIWRDKDLIEKIWSNYFVFISENWEKEDVQESLDRALKTTLNQLIYNISFSRTESFDLMVLDVKNKELSFDERYEQLKKVDTLINTQQWAYWKTSKEFKEKIYKQTLNKQEISSKFEEIQKQVKAYSENKKINNLKQVLNELNELKENSEEIWEVFIAWEIDKFIENNESTLKET